MFDSIKKLFALRKLNSLWHKRDITSQKWWDEFIGTSLKIPEITDFVRDTMKNLQGYKTYILAAAIAGVVLAKQLGYLDETTANTILTLLGAGTASTLAAKMNRTEEIAKNVEYTTLITKDAAVQTNNVIQPLVSPSQNPYNKAGATGGGMHPADSTFRNQRSKP